MSEFENLGCNTYGITLSSEKITSIKNHNVSVFLTVENTDDKDIIYKEALQMLVAFGKGEFYFYGKQEPLWHLAFDELDAQMNSSDCFSNTVGCETLEEFVDELEDERHLPNNDCYLIYDHEKIYNKVKQMIV